MPIFVLVSGLAFVGAGCFLLWQGHDPATAWGSILFFGGCSAIAVWELVHPRIKSARYAAFIDAKAQRRTLVVKSDVAHFVAFTIGSAGFALAGVLMITTERHPCVGWLTAGFFGPGALLLGWQIFDRRPRLVIDSDGVFDRTIGIGRIDWDDIESAHLNSTNGNDFICLVLRDPSLYVDQMSWLRRKLASANAALGFSSVTLNLSGITISPEEVLQLVTGYILKHQITREDEPGRD